MGGWGEALNDVFDPRDTVKVVLSPRISSADLLPPRVTSPHFTLSLSLSRCFYFSSGYSWKEQHLQI